MISFQLGRTSEAIKSCTDVLGADENDFEAYCDRGDAYLMEDNYDAAIKDFQAAKNINGDFHRVSLNTLQNSWKLFSSFFTVYVKFYI